MKTFRYKAVLAKQARGHQVFSFAAHPSEILEFAEIDRVSRNSEGSLEGFQRHQISSHIKEIRTYLGREDALLPNPIVIAFIKGVTVSPMGDGLAEIEINVEEVKPGYVVDGQQRLTALSGLNKPDFQVFVSTLICRDYNELRQQFVLINNTRPLPKTLIYELLPTVEGLPERFSERSFAAKIVEMLNYGADSSLRAQIHQHTNPRGVISSSAVQKLIMNSSSDGAIREFLSGEDYLQRSWSLINEFFWAVRKVFDSDWDGMTTKTSRLLHGAGIISLGFCMETLYSRTNATTREDFEKGLELIKEKLAWTSGQWILSSTDVRPWNGIQNTPGDVDLLSSHIVRELKIALRSQLPLIENTIG